jgi:hypothetical protein
LAPTLFARGGQISPNGTGFGAIAPGLAAGPGNTVFMASTEISNALHSVFLASPSGITAVSEPRGPVPGVTGARFKIVDRPCARGNSSGLYAFRGNFEFVEGGQEHHGLWAGASASLNLIGLVGEQVPGLAPGHTFITFDTNFMNDAGGLAFRALVRTPHRAQTGAFLMGTAAGVQAFTGPGLPAPPICPAGSFLGTTIRDFTDRGELLANGSSGGQPAYFVGSASGFRRIIVNGETPANAPGLRAVVRTDSFGESLLNNSGISVVNAALVGALNTNLGLLVQSPECGLLVLAAPGGLFEVAPGDIRVIDRAILRDFNDRSEVLYVLRSTDQTEALVLNAVPAPGSAGVLVLGLASASSRRRRRPLGAGPA